MTQLQYTAMVPLTVDEITVNEELECEVFVSVDLNDEPYVSEIQFEDQNGKSSRTIKLTAESVGFEAVLWNALRTETWEAVESEVQEKVLEAA